MDNPILDFLSRIYWDFVYRIIRYQYLIYAIVFAALALILVEFWVIISQPPNLIPNTYHSGTSAILMWTPDQMFIGEENKQRIDFGITGVASREIFPITITVDSPDVNVSFSQNQVVLEGNNNQTKEERSIEVFYRRVSSPADSFQVIATFTIGEKQGELTENIAVDNTTKKTILFVSSAITGMIALLSVVNQIRNLARKNN